MQQSHNKTGKRRHIARILASLFVLWGCVFSTPVAALHTVLRDADGFVIPTSPSSRHAFKPVSPKPVAPKRLREEPLPVASPSAEPSLTPPRGDEPPKKRQKYQPEAPSPAEEQKQAEALQKAEKRKGAAEREEMIIQIFPLLAYQLGALYKSEEIICTHGSHEWRGWHLAPLFFETFRTVVREPIPDPEAFWESQIAQYGPLINTSHPLPHKRICGRWLTCFLHTLNRFLRPHKLSFSKKTEIFSTLPLLGKKHPDGPPIVKIDLESLRGGRPMKVIPAFASGLPEARLTAKQMLSASASSRPEDMTVISPPAKPAHIEGQRPITGHHMGEGHSGGE